MGSNPSISINKRYPPILHSFLNKTAEREGFAACCARFPLSRAGFACSPKSPPQADFLNGSHPHGFESLFILKIEIETIIAILFIKIGGEGGIRTLGNQMAAAVFETAPIVHSGTSPCGRNYSTGGKKPMRVQEDMRRYLRT